MSSKILIGMWIGRTALVRREGFCLDVSLSSVQGDVAQTGIASPEHECAHNGFIYRKS